jgi:hypothetical protein
MYKLLKNNEGTISGVLLTRQNGSLLCVPFALDNTDYQEYLKWVAEGNEPLPPDSQE